MPVANSQHYRQSRVAYFVAGPEMREHRLAILIALIFLALALWYNVILPIGESDNEISHYRYIQYIKTERRLPPVGYVWPVAPSQDQCEIALGTSVQNPEPQFRQPPLYYTLSALATAWLNPSDNWWPPTNHFGVHNRNFDGGFNMSVHTAREAFPYQGTVLSVHVTRLFSTLLGLWGLLAVYLSGRLIFGQKPGPSAALFMATVAFVPTYLFASAVVNNDIMVGALGLWCIYFCLRSVLSRARPGYFFLALLFLALAVLAKYNGILLIIPLGVTAIALIVRLSLARSQRWRRSLVGAGLAAIAGLLVLGLWLWRNKELYGTYVIGYPYLAQSVNTKLGWLGAYPGGELIIKLAKDSAFSFGTYWALLGADVIRLPVWLSTLLFVVCVAVAVGILRNLLDKTKPRHLKALAVAAALILIANWWLLYLLFNLAPARGRYLLPLFSVAGFLLVWGSSALRTRRRPWLGSALLVGLLLLICLFVPNSLLLPAYARPAILTEPALGPDAQRIQATFGDFAELLAVEIEPKSIAPFEPLQVTLVWRVLQPTTNNYAIGVHLSGADNTYYGGSAHMPANGNYATSLWQPGDIFRDRYTLYMEKPPGSKLPSGGKIKITMYCATPTDEIYVPVTDNAGVALGDAVYAGPLRLGLPVTATQASDVPVLARFGDEIDLLAIDQVSSTSEDGSLSLPLQFTWRARQQPRTDYTLYLHLLDAQGHYVAGIDEKLALDDYPSALWPPGEVVTDVHPAEISSLLHIPSGTYRLVAGLYDHQTMERLPITTATLPADVEGITLGRWENTLSWQFMPYVISENRPP